MARRPACVVVFVAGRHRHCCHGVFVLVTCFWLLQGNRFCARRTGNGQNGDGRRGVRGSDGDSFHILSSGHGIQGSRLLALLLQLIV